jgi:hypothetical protein
LNEDDKIECYYYSPDWSNPKKFIPQEIKAFNQNESEASQLLYFKNYVPSMTYYAVPDWSAGQRAIEINVESLNFHMNNLRKGMNPSLWINYNNGIPGEEEQRIIVRALESQYGGSDNAGQAIISFNESKEQSPEITQIQTSGNDGYYQAIYDDILRSILSAHRVSSGELYGISTSGKLGTRNEIVDHSEYFRKMVIQPYQKELLGTFDKLVSMKYEKPTTFEIKPLSIYLVGDVNEQPIVESANFMKYIEDIADEFAIRKLREFQKVGLLSQNEVQSIIPRYKNTPLTYFIKFIETFRKIVQEKGITDHSQIKDLFYYYVKVGNVELFKLNSN